MAWIIRFVLLALVVAAGIVGWSAGGALASDLEVSSLVAGDADGEKVTKLSTGPALQSRIVQDLSVINAQRESRRDGDVRAVFLEKVSFERSAGGVVARGSILDLGAPRAVNVVIDAFDGSRNYLSSASSPVQSSATSTPFTVSMMDEDRFQSFSVRFLDAGMEEIVMRSADTPIRKVPPVLVDDPLHAADLSEVAERLVMLGYAAKAQPVRDEIVAAALVSRFRKDYGLGGQSGVTVGDLVALRIVSGPSKSRADLGAY